MHECTNYRLQYYFKFNPCKQEVCHFMFFIVSFTPALHAFGADTYGVAYFPTLVGGFMCDGTESSLSACTKNVGSTTMCANNKSPVQCVEKGPCEKAGYTTGCCVSGCGQFGETPVSARSEKAHNVHTAYMLWKWCPWFTHSVARLEMIVI